jgi:hypothetical protein
VSGRDARLVGVANIGAGDFRTYLEVFHETYLHGVERHIDPDMRGFLDRYPRLPCRIKGYVSTSFGVAFEYVGGNEQVAVERSSRRCEFMLLDPPAPVRKLQPLIVVGYPGCGIARLSLEGSLPFLLTSTQASLKLEDVGFKAFGWSRAVGYAEVFGDRSDPLWTPEQAVRRANDEILAALADINDMKREHLEISRFLDREKRQTVLIAGDFGEKGMRRLNAIRKGVRECGYLPRLLSDVPDMPDYDLTDKFVALGQTARFVVFDDSSAAGHLREFEVAAQRGWVVAVLRMAGTHSSVVTRGEALKSRVLREWAYTDDNLGGVLYEVTEWAESTVKELREGRDEIYPWRDSNPSSEPT